MSSNGAKSTTAPDNKDTPRAQRSRSRSAHREGNQQPNVQLTTNEASATRAEATLTEVAPLPHVGTPTRSEPAAVTTQTINIDEFVRESLAKYEAELMERLRNMQLHPPAHVEEDPDGASSSSAATTTQTQGNLGRARPERQPE